MSDVCGNCQRYSPDLNKCLKKDMYCIFSQIACKDDFKKKGIDVITQISSEIYDQNHDIIKRKEYEYNLLRSNIKKLEKEITDKNTLILKIEKEQGSLILEVEKKLEAAKNKISILEDKLKESETLASSLKKQIESKDKLISNNQIELTKKTEQLNKLKTKTIKEEIKEEEKPKA